MPLITLRGAASAVSFGFLSAQSKLYWIGLVGGAVNTNGYAGAYDSTGAFVVGGQTYTGTNYIGLVLKFSPTGTVIWQQQAPYTQTRDNAAVASIAIGSADSIYLGVETSYTAGSPKYSGYYIKCDTDGVNDFTGLALNVDSANPTCSSILLVTAESKVRLSGQVYASTLGSGASNSRADTTTSFRIGSGVMQDGSTTIFGGYNTGTGRTAYVFYTSSLGFFSGRLLGGGTGLDAARAVISLGTDIVIGYLYENAAAITRFVTSSTTPVWTRRLNVNSTVYGLCVDDDNYIYACTANGTVFKYSESGVLQWQRAFTCAGGSFNLRGIAIDSVGTLAVTGTVTAGGASQMFVARVPSDGSATNTVPVGGVSISYAASAYTENTAATAAWSNSTPADSGDIFTAFTGGGTLEASAATTDIGRL